MILGGFEIMGKAYNGEEAVSIFKSFSVKPKVILMDHRMPLKNGIEASKEILRIERTTKIIFTTADGSIKEEAFAIGAFSFLDKLFSIEYLIDEITRAFESYNSSLSD